MSVELYPFQADAVEGLRANIRQGVKSQILCAPTGSGKTEMALHLIRECHAKGKRAVFVVDRLSLLDQTSQRMDRWDIPHGVIQSQHWRWRPWERVQVASVQTINRRQWPEADLLVIDEAHGVHKAVTDRLAPRDTVAIGLTATPFTRGLGKHYDRIVCVTTTRKLIEEKFLSPYTIYAASEPDMTGVKVNQKGEWDEAETTTRVLPIVGDCVAEYLKHGNGQKFIAFGVTVAHCAELARQFQAAGVLATLYTYQTPDDERARTVAEFKKRDSAVRGLISVAALVRGFDVEDVGVVIVARPLRKSLAEHIQMLGRGLRRDPANPEKTCVILDHSGNCIRFWDDMNAFYDHGWNELDDGTKRPKKKPKKPEREPRKCPSCSHVHAPRPTCPLCGFEYPRKTPRHAAGELVALGSGSSASASDRRSVHAQLLWIALERGYKSGWAAHQYAERFGSWPPRGSSPEPQVASPEILSWVRSRMIRYHKGREKLSREAAR